MPSPFPGMNPYLEQGAVWPDFHNTFLVTLRTAILPRVVPRYFVELEVSLYLDPTEGDDRLFAVADAAVHERTPQRAGGTATAEVAAPVTVTVPGVTKRKTRRLVIRDTNSREIVTVIELLSPSNKEAGPDRTRYEDKRAEILNSAASLVEFDFLRGGRRMPFRNLPPCTYYALVSRPWGRPDIGLWPVGLRDSLPTVPIPLRRGEAEPLADLQAVLHQVYDGAGYGYYIYDTSPEPRLSPDDAAWAESLIPAKN